MRFLIKVSLPVEAGNRAIKDGNLMKKMPAILAELKPEAAYFTEEGGKRTGFIFVNIQEPSQIPAVAEPFFLAFNAAVELHPAMTPEDLAKSQPGIERAIKNYA